MKPRAPLYWENWNQNHRFYVLLIALTVGLLGGGFGTLVGLNAGDRLEGLASLAVGLVLVGIVVVYLRRPVESRAQRRD